MGRNIVFMSIFDLTRPMHGVSTVLERQGHAVFWITTNLVWTRWLLEQGVEQARILSLVYRKEQFLADEEKAELLKEIVACEAATDLTVNQILMMDQFVTYKKKSNINEYVYLYYRDIRRFLAVNEISCVFAEPTNTNELITYMICRELGIRYLAPWDMRYPRNRIMYIDGYLQSPIVPSGKRVNGPETGERLLREFREQQITPFYFEKHNQTRIINPVQLMRAVRNRLVRGHVTEQDHLTHHSLSERLTRLMRRTINSWYLRRVMKYDRLSEIKGRVAVFGLHVQPEASIDVRGSYFSDQLKLIKDIRRSLPFNMTLIVKEHPNFLGGRGRRFFRQLRQLPNVAIVKHDVSAFILYEKADIVFTVSGTTAYEAGMLGIPAVTFSPMFFGELSSVRYCADITRLKPLVERLLKEFERDYDADCRFMGHLMNHSYEGYWTNPLLDPTVMAPDNIDSLSRAFLEVLDDSDAQRPGRTDVSGHAAVHH